MLNNENGLFFELGIDSKKLLDGLDRAAKSINDFEGRATEGFRLVANGLNEFERKMREALEPIDQIAIQFSKSGLIAGKVSDEVAEQILDIGTTSQKAALTAGRAFDSIESKLGGLGLLLKTLFAPIAAAFAGGRLAQNFSQMGEELSVLSERTGVAVEKIDAWAKANRDAGGSAESFKDALQQWTIETGRGADEFFKMGEHVKGMTDVQARYFMRAMGLSQEASAIFIKHKDAADQVAESYKSVAFTKEQAENARRMNILWRQFTNTAQSLANTIAVAVLPIVNKVLSVLSDGLAFLNEHSRAVKILLGGLGAVIAGTYLRKILALIGGLKGLFATVKAGTTIVAAFNAVLMANPLGVVIAAVAALGLAIDDLMSFLEGGGSLFGDFMRWIGFSDRQINEFRKNLGNFLSAIASIPGQIADAVASIFGFFGDVYSAATSTFEKVRSVIANIPLAIVEGIPKALSWLKEKLKSLLGGFGSLVSGLFEDDDEDGEDNGDAIANRRPNRIKWENYQDDGIEYPDDEEQEIPRSVKVNRTQTVLSKSAVRESHESVDRRINEKLIKHLLLSSPQPVAAQLIGEISMPQMPVANGAIAAIRQKSERSGGITNDMKVTVENHIQTTADPQAVGQAVSVGVDRALTRSNRNLVNAQTGVVQKG
jgi:hypothetical protein